jgi:hypothetical protein
LHDLLQHQQLPVCQVGSGHLLTQQVQCAPATSLPLRSAGMAGAASRQQLEEATFWHSAAKQHEGFQL